MHGYILLTFIWLLIAYNTEESHYISKSLFYFGSIFTHSQINTNFRFHHLLLVNTDTEKAQLDKHTSSTRRGVAKFDQASVKITKHQKLSYV